MYRAPTGDRQAQRAQAERGACATQLAGDVL
jgi:hypothetical protein